MSRQILGEGEFFTIVESRASYRFRMAQALLSRVVSEFASENMVGGAYEGFSREQFFEHTAEAQRQRATIDEHLKDVSVEPVSGSCYDIILEEFWDSFYEWAGE